MMPSDVVLPYLLVGKCVIGVYGIVGRLASSCVGRSTVVLAAHTFDSPVIHVEGHLVLKESTVSSNIELSIRRKPKRRPSTISAKHQIWVMISMIAWELIERHSAQSDDHARCEMLDLWG